MTAPDVARVIAANDLVTWLKDPMTAWAGMTQSTNLDGYIRWLEEKSKSAAAHIEFQAQALSDANGNADTYCEWWREQCDRANKLEAEIHTSFDKWSKSLGWGLSGHQPECWAMMDLAVDELVRSRSRLAEAMRVIELGLVVISEKRGWGTYPRMEGSEIYSDASVFADAARDFLNAANARANQEKT